MRKRPSSAGWDARIIVAAAAVLAAALLALVPGIAVPVATALVSTAAAVEIFRARESRRAQVLVPARARRNRR